MKENSKAASIGESWDASVTCPKSISDIFDIPIIYFPTGKNKPRFWLPEVIFHLPQVTGNGISRTLRIKNKHDKYIQMISSHIKKIYLFHFGWELLHLPITTGTFP